MNEADSLGVALSGTHFQHRHDLIIAGLLRSGMAAEYPGKGLANLSSVIPVGKHIRQHMKEPTVQEIADEIGISKEDVVYALDAIQMPVSLHEPVYSDGGDTLYVMDQVSDKKNKEENWVEELSLEAAMERLNERERYIITLRFFEGKTQMEVAEQINISQAQVSRLEKNALKIMRKYLLGD